MNQSRNHRPLVVTDDGDDGSPCASGLRVCRTPRATSLGVSRASNAMRVIPSRSPRASVGSVASPCGAHVDVVVGIGDVAIHGWVCVCTPVCTSVCLSVCRARARTYLPLSVVGTRAMVWLWMRVRVGATWTRGVVWAR